MPEHRSTKQSAAISGRVCSHQRTSTQCRAIVRRATLLRNDSLKWRSFHPEPLWHGCYELFQMAVGEGDDAVAHEQKLTARQAHTFNVYTRKKVAMIGARLHGPHRSRLVGA